MASPTLMDVSLSELRELLMDREAWRGAISDTSLAMMMLLALVPHFDSVLKSVESVLLNCSYMSSVKLS